MIIILKPSISSHGDAGQGQALSAGLSADWAVSPSYPIEKEASSCSMQPL